MDRRVAAKQISPGRFYEADRVKAIVLQFFWGLFR